ncbi:MAG: lycopene cyclase domain-containing protein [Patescibacteria group bacterium]|nr:lycopene cyclase domain-containing protein [Patescibacteria group bacterium]
MDYFYLVGILLALPFWVFLFIRKEHRKEILIMGLIFGVAAVVIEHAYAKWDYWHPVYIFPKVPFEDFLYGVVYGGISSELYEIFWKVKDSEFPRHETYKEFFLLGILLVAGTFWLLVDTLALNSITAHIVPPIIVGIIVGSLRKELVKFQLFNGVVIALLTFGVFKLLFLIYPGMIEKYWMLENLSGVFVLQVPVEELLFAFAVGFGASCFYELAFGYALVKK